MDTIGITRQEIERYEMNLVTSLKALKLIPIDTRWCGVISIHFHEGGLCDYVREEKGLRRRLGKLIGK